MSAESGLTGTTENSFSMGDGLDGYKYIYANISGSSDPAIRWSSGDVRWEYSNDGATYSAIGSGSGVSYPSTLYTGTTPTLFTDTAIGIENSIIADGYFQFDKDMSSVIFGIESTATSNGMSFLITGQSDNSLIHNGGDLKIKSGDGYLAGNIYINAGDSNVGNIAFFTDSIDDWDSGKGIMFLKDSTVVPNGNPTNGGYLYSKNGSLRWRGSSGTVTIIAPA